MTVIGTIREWNDDEGWGVIDSPRTPGGCWALFSQAAVSGYVSFTAGQSVRLEWESPGQDGWPYRAVRFWPEGQEPVDRFADATGGPGGAYHSTLSLSFDDDPEGTDRPRE
ncbi:cold shock domain-containing protein [Actinoplanes oblitus]|uniref:Cold shock domain-containing protein n=1 Tax=Actinoplanes oblitus TaxID=3040509 RepID=A0ABY8W983_9ACTN|nr:cold shock domain-containing protein [Actinoplanes oblitus]WIM92998.1 cold shock domain-containing protein [Actinoplanes oblitus]